MQKTPTIAILTLALLTAPALAGGVTSSTDDPPSVWLPEGKLASPTPGAEMGAEVAIHEDTAVVAAPGTDQALVYERSPLGWVQATTLSTDAPSDDFGSSVAVDDGRLVIGARLADAGSVSFAGAAYVYDRAGDEWTRTAKLTASDADTIDVFGESVAIDGDTIAVGASAVDTEQAEDAGAVYVYQYEGSGWSQVANLTAPDPVSSGALGVSVDVDGDTLVAGSWVDVAHVYHHDGDGWGHETRLEGPQLGGFGRALDVAASTIAVGAPWEPAVAVFEDSPSGWTQETVLSASDVSPTAIEGVFGASVSLDASGETLLVGAAGDDRTPAGPEPANVGVPCHGLRVTGTCQRAGAAYLFDDIQSGGWGLESKVVAPDGAPSDEFGASVALEPGGGAALVGAPAADLGHGDDAGSTYPFQLTAEEA